MLRGVKKIFNFHILEVRKSKRSVFFGKTEKKVQKFEKYQMSFVGVAE